MKTKLISAVVLVALLVAAFGAFAPAPVAAAGETISIAPVSGLAGNQVTLAVKVNSNGTPTRGYSLYLYFDPTLFTITSITPSTGASDPWNAALDGVNGVSSPSCSDASAQLSQVHSKNVNPGEVQLAEAVLGCNSASTGAMAWPVNGTVASIVLTLKPASGLGTTPNGVTSNVFYTGSTPKFLDVTGATIQPALNLGYVRVGPAPALTIQSVTFTPANGSSTPSVAVIIKNTGTVAMTPGTDDTTVTLAMSTCTPATKTFSVTSLAVGATTELDQAYAACGAVSTFTVSDTVYDLQYSTSYLNAVTFPQVVTVDGSMPVMYIDSTIVSNVNFGTMVYGLNVKQVGMNINTNAPNFTVTAHMDNWNLTEWNGSAYVTPSPFSLHDPMHLAAYLGDGVTQVGNNVSSDGTFFTGTIAGQSADAGQNFFINFIQTLHHDDATLPSGYTYHGVVTFTDAASF